MEEAGTGEGCLMGHGRAGAAGLRQDASPIEPQGTFGGGMRGKRVSCHVSWTARAADTFRNPGLLQGNGDLPGNAASRMPP